MSRKRYTEEFRIEAVKRVTERGHSVADLAQRVDITTHSLYAWKEKTLWPVRFGRCNTPLAKKSLIWERILPNIRT
jgi:hypothetical protein